MTKLVWDNVTERPYSYGVDRGILHIPGGSVIAWNGLVSVEEKEADGSDLTSYFDGLKYANFLFSGVYEADVRAFGFPASANTILGLKEVFPGLSLTAQPRVTFDFSYRTLIGESEYKIHIIHNALAVQTKHSASTISDSVDVEELLWTITTTPPNASTYRPCSHLVVDTTTTNPSVLTVLENALYGTNSVNPYFPTQAQIITMFTP